MLNIVALIPACNEQSSIAATIEGLLAQTRRPDQIVVIPNGCVDNTANIARSFGADVTVLDLPKLDHRKSEALNMGWQRYAKGADLVVCLDADTVLPPNAVADWEHEFVEDRENLIRAVLTRNFTRQNTQPLGGSSSKFTMQGNDFLTRLQRFEFARWTDTALSRGWTTVLAGTGCAISGDALREVVRNTRRPGPWGYDSQVEDFELTYQIRKLGYRCQVSPTVRAYTDSMKTLRALWGQRMKWAVGTVEDLLKTGLNSLTIVDWWQQASGLFMAFTRLLWVLVIVAQVAFGMFHFNLLWWLVVPVTFAGTELYSALRIPHRDRLDILCAITIIPSEIFAWMRAGWFIASWFAVLRARITGVRRDRWHLQYAAEGSA